MKTASIMVRDDKVVCVEFYDSDLGECDILSFTEAAQKCEKDDVYVWGYGEHLDGTRDLKKLFFERHNFYISFRAFAPFKSIKPSVQLAEVLSGLRTEKRLFWRTRAGAKKAWWDASFGAI